MINYVVHLKHSLMSVYVQTDTVNSTVILHEDSKSLLTPGQIAVITISTTFAFYLTIMFVVCMGEYCQYKKGKKKKMEVRRKRHSGYSPSTGNAESEIRSGSQFDSSQSDYTSSFQARQSLKCEPQPTTSTRLESVLNHSIEEKSYNTVHHQPSISKDNVISKTSTDDLETIPFEESLSNVNTDCDRTCKNGSQDVVMLPLIARQCDDILDIDGEIFCDSVDSRDMYHLEADV